MENFDAKFEPESSDLAHKQRELFNLMSKHGTENVTPIEMESFLYDRCINCNAIFEERRDACSLCSGTLTTGLGMRPKTEADKKLLELIESLQEGYKLTCGKCGNIINSANIDEACPRCGDANPKNYVPNLNGINLTQEIKIKKYDSRMSKTKGKQLEIQMHDEKPQHDGSTAKFLRIMDKENNNYEELVIINQQAKPNTNVKNH